MLWGMKAIRVPPLSAEAVAELDAVYRHTKSPRLRTRAQMVLLAGEQQLVAAQIATIVRECEETVRRWLKRYVAEGVAGLQDAPRPGAAPTVTPAWRQRLVELVRQRPRALGLSYSLWTCQRLADVLAEETGLRVSDETVRRYLAAEGIVMSRPQHTVSSPDPEYALKKRRLSRHAIT